MTDLAPSLSDARLDDPAGGLKFGPLDERLGYVLRRAQVAVFRDFFKTFEPLDIKPAQYSILTIIECNPGLKQTQVGDALGIKRTNFVGMIDELESRGLVRRDEALGDRRSYALVLTPQGEDLMPRLHELSAAHEQRIVAALGAKRRQKLAGELATLAAYFRSPGGED
jgi:DNA-binding MarR family transcriptional regulator